MSSSNGDFRYAFSHLDDSGQAKMVDVSGKAPTQRRARAEGWVRISSELEDAIRDQSVPKGNLFEVARIAGIQAAKATDRLIPLCHSLPLDGVSIALSLEDHRIHIVAEVVTTAKTGVEMEALTAVSVAALTVIDMGKAIDRSMVIDGITVLEKTGGRHGEYRREKVAP